MPMTPKGTLTLLSSIRWVIRFFGTFPPEKGGRLRVADVRSDVPANGFCQFQAVVFRVGRRHTLQILLVSLRMKSVLFMAASATASNIWLISLSLNASMLRLASCTATKSFV